MVHPRQSLKKRVLVFRPELSVGGADRVTVTLLREMSRKKFVLELALLKMNGLLLSEVPPDVKVHDLNAPSLWSAVAPLRRLLRTTKPDVLFSTCSGANVPAVLAHQLEQPQSRALVLSERSVVVRTPFTPQRLILPFLKRALYRNADRITAVSDGVAKDLTDLLEVETSRVVSIGNPMVTDDLPALANAPVEHLFFADPLLKTVVTMGRMVDEKKHEDLVRAFRLLHASRPRTRLLILGDGPLRSKLEALIESLGLHDVVSMPGFRQNPFPYLRASTVFALSSSTEGLPGALIQAMALGLPAVSTDCHAGPAEVIDQPGKNGVLVGVRDVAALAHELGQLLDDEERRERIAQAGQQTVERYRSANVVAAYEKAVDDALAA